MEHMLAGKITEWCLKRKEMSETQAVAVTYGIELLFNSLFKLIGLLLLGIIFHRTWDVILSIGCFSLLRSFAGGVHMKTSLGCFLSMVCVWILSCVGAEYITYLPLAVMIALTVLIVVLIKRYAPFFTQNNPITDEKILRKKNIGAVVTASALLAIIWLVPVWRLKMIMLIPVTLETLSMLPCWHGKRKTER